MDKFPCEAWNGIPRKENNANVHPGHSVTQIVNPTGNKIVVTRPVVTRTAEKEIQTETQTGAQTGGRAVDQEDLENNNHRVIKTETVVTEDRNRSRMQLS